MYGLNDETNSIFWLFELVQLLQRIKTLPNSKQLEKLVWQQINSTNQNRKKTNQRRSRRSGDSSISQRSSIRVTPRLRVRRPTQIYVHSPSPRSPVAQPALAASAEMYFGALNFGFSSSDNAPPPPPKKKQRKN